MPGGIPYLMRYLDLNERKVPTALTNAREHMAFIMPHIGNSHMGNKDPESRDPVKPPGLTDLALDQLNLMTKRNHDKHMKSYDDIHAMMYYPALLVARLLHDLYTCIVPCSLFRLTCIIHELFIANIYNAENINPRAHLWISTLRVNSLIHAAYLVCLQAHVLCSESRGFFILNINTVIRNIIEMSFFIDGVKLNECMSIYSKTPNNVDPDLHEPDSAYNYSTSSYPRDPAPNLDESYSFGNMMKCDEVRGMTVSF